LAKKPTVGDILKESKKQSQKIRKQQLAKVKKVTGRLPIKGPIGLGVDIADLASQISQALVNQASDIAFRDLQNVELPSPGAARTILPDVDQIARTMTEPGKLTRVRSDKQLINDQIMRDGMKDANTRARKKNGQLKKGMTQKKVAVMAQRYCTKERQRLGLCEKPMKRRKRGKSSR
jgi:hypothetical protein|tara:strand:- start:290 stop:820 length:531 start_codon:yes stop_codon:yes gene_type:complete